MISDHHLQKLLDHNFIDLFTRDELKRATEPRNWYGIADTLKSTIEEIERHELEHPLGINSSNPFWINYGSWNYETKEFTFSSDNDGKFTLEDLKFYYKLLTFLKVVDTL